MEWDAAMSTPSPTCAFVNGELLPAEEARISAFDEGFTLGLSVYETLLSEAGFVYFVEDHLERLCESVRALGVSWPLPWDVSAAVHQVADASASRDVALRITLSRGVRGRGPTLVVAAREISRAPEGGICLALSDRAKLGAAPLEGVKTTNRLRNVLALEEAQAAGAWEALLPTEEGDYSEGTVSNVFAVLDGRLTTPPLERGCLPGIMRQKVLDVARAAPLRVGGSDLGVETARLERSALELADELFLTNTTGRVIPVRTVLGIEKIYPGSKGPLAIELGRRIGNLEASYRGAHDPV